MVSPKKKSSRAAKARASSEKKSRKTAPARKKTPPPRLTTEEKLSKLKPGDDLNELVAEVATAWSLVSRKVRVADVSIAKLRSLGKKAQKAQTREAELAAKQGAKLAPVSDARIIANDAAYRAALQVKRIADAVGTTNPSVAEAFAGVTERFRRMPAAKPGPAGT